MDRKDEFIQHRREKEKEREKNRKRKEGGRGGVSIRISLLLGAKLERLGQPPPGVVWSGGMVVSQQHWFAG